MTSSTPSSFFLDDQTGSPELALHEPVRSLLRPCSLCNGSSTLATATAASAPSPFAPVAPACPHCSGTGRLLTTLTAGDALLIGNGPDGKLLVGVEVKRLSELITSLHTSRLNGVNGQLARMADLYAENWLLYYGAYRPNLDNGALQIPVRAVASAAAPNGYEWRDYYHPNGDLVLYGYVEAFLCSPSFTHLGFRAKHVHDLPTAAWWLGVLYHTWSRPWDSHKSLKNIFRQPVPKRMLEDLDPLMQRRLVALAGFPELGYQRALAVLKHFVTVGAVAAATVDELAQVTVPDAKGKTKRLGSSIARGIKDVFG